MKLLRWPLAGVTAYVIYRYAIGKKAKGEKVFDSPESGEEDVSPKAPAKPARPKPRPLERGFAKFIARAD